MAENNSGRKTYEELVARNRELEAQLNGGRNREYKSRLFSFLFGREENKHWTLSLYNAIHGTSHEDPSSITINTMEDVIYMGMKNDLSILVSETVNLYRSMELYEQQSSFNPNMPVREFMYAGKLYDKFIHSAKLNRYSRSLLPLPLPKLVVFYNGEDEKEDEVVLRLSDSFREEIRQNILSGYAENKERPNDDALSAEVEKIFEEASPDIEVTVRMLNINHGHNSRILTACRPLWEYAWFVAQVRNNRKAGTNGTPAEPGAAIDRAINDMPDDFVIKEFILSNRAEVKDMCLTEYDAEEAREMFRQEGRIEGRQEGQIEGWQKAMLLAVQNIMDSTGWAADQAMDMLKIPDDQRTAFYQKLSKHV